MTDYGPGYDLVDGVLLGPTNGAGERIRLDPETRIPLSLIRVTCASGCGWYGTRFESMARLPGAKCPNCGGRSVPAWE